MNYDPEMAQWQGDGELVGVRSRIILTAEPSVAKGTTYFSKVNVDIILIYLVCANKDD